MKYTNVFALASVACAAPAPLVNTDAPTPVASLERRSSLNDALTGVIGSLSPAVTTDVAAIQSTLNTVRSSVYYYVDIKWAIGANYQNIINALQSATGTIVPVTTGAVGGIGNALTGLATNDLNAIQTALTQIQSLTAQINATAFVSMTNLAPDLQLFLKNETAALQNALTPLVTPVTQLGTAVSAAKVIVGVGASGLTNLPSGVASVITSFLKNIFG